MTWTIEPIGIIHTCFEEKFGIPRQPGLIPEATGFIELCAPYDRAECVRGLEGFSHIWLSFIFHGCPEGQWSPTVRPPRLGGNERVGVFATRSTFRPNAMGLSVVELDRIEVDPVVRIYVRGHDLMDQTPIVDIKPYLTWADSLPHATSGFAREEPSPIPVRFTSEAEASLEALEPNHPTIKSLIERVIGFDPRPAYKQKDSASQAFGVKLSGFNIRWVVEDGAARIEEITRTTS